MISGDLTTVFVGYVGDLRDAAAVPPDLDSTTLVHYDEAHMRSVTHSPDDLPTAYYEYLH